MSALRTPGRRGGLLLLSTALCFGLAAPVWAQDQAASEEQEEIVVTGSRIHRDPLNNASPVADVTAADIDRTGLTSTADILQRQPFSGGGLNALARMTKEVSRIEISPLLVVKRVPWAPMKSPKSR